MIPVERTRALRLGSKALWIGAFALALCGVAGCVSSLLPTPAAPPTQFILDDGAATSTASTTVPTAATNGLTLLVDPPRAAAGFDSARLVYQRRPNELEFFAHNEWVDTPARMLAPLLRRAVDRSGAFRAVIDTPMSAAADLRLDSEIVRLQQDFVSSPSRVRLVLRVTLVDLAAHRVVASRQFDASEPAVTDDPRGGVDAANRVVSRVLGEAAAFCVEASSKRR